MLDETHDPAARSWVGSADLHQDFPIQNLPLGIFSPPGGSPRAGVAIGDQILDLAAAAPLLEGEARLAASASGATLNPLLALGAGPRAALRRALFARLRRHAGPGELAGCLHAAAICTLHLPAHVGDYTDFYAGIHHALHVGRLFRPDAPLLPNYKYVPIGYHGRASSVRVSGAPVIRPDGQTKRPDTAGPSFGPTARLDYEMELGIWIGPGNAAGVPIPIAEAGSHIAGFCLLNDWSARDVQAWEYQPLGPFLAKSFVTTVSPWLITPEALAPFRIAQPARADGDPAPLPYLSDPADQATGSFAIELVASLRTASMRDRDQPPYKLSRVAMANLYWTPAQLIAHHASNGCDLRPGDLLGTGTISAPDPSSYGSLLELTRGGGEPIALPNGETRLFLHDGDEIRMTARASAPGRVSIGFGECVGRVVARPGTAAQGPTG